MTADERIVLDAVIEAVINAKAFHARLRNGHRFVAFVRGAPAAPAYGPGDRVRVELSPYDLSKGQVMGRISGENET